ncbi:MAG: ParB/RepB/Spo0J family partition protein, partial [Candidatus Aminicenantes bacterium]|nr:ParB/RepB/Spo0J family partition protein [Candidatus Aminicenantes bacterium]
MPKKVGLPEFIKSRHDMHFVEEISTRTRTSIIRNIPIDKLVTNILQPRKDMGDLEELAQSIKEMGIIEPIIVRTRDGKFEIIAGERRFKAAELAGLTEIPCIEHEVPDNEALEITIIENIQRKDLNLFETAFSLKSLNDIYGYTHQDIAQKIGKSRVTVTELIRITELPPDVVKRCLELNITSKTFVLELSKLKNREDMLEMLKMYVEKPFSRDAIKAKRKEIYKNKDKKSVFNFKF